MKLFIDPHLTRQVVLATAQHCPEAAREHRERADAIYALPLSQREAAFGRLYGELFLRWELDQVPNQVAAEFSHLQPPVAALYLSAAKQAGEEALLSRERDKVGIKLCPSRFQEPGRLEGELRHQLTHISDALHHGFTVPSGRRGEAAVGERYLVLWDTYIDGRLESQGRPGGESREERLSQFRAAFPQLPSETAPACFDRVWEAPELAHATLLYWAEQPDRLAPGKSAPVAGARCPLCAFPTYDWATADPRLAKLVAGDFPLWQPEQGLCQRCAEMYQVRAGIW